MAYCVHCGVKLGDSEPRCPLCGTVSVDPHQSQNDPQPRPYPARTQEQTLHLNRKYLITLMSVLLLLPALLCAVIDLLLGGGLSWSIYPSAALALLWIAVIVPLSMKKNRTYTSLVVDYFTINGYLYMVQQFDSNGRWFFPIVLPVFTLSMLLLALILWLYRHDKLNKVTLLACALFAVALICFSVELMIMLHIGGLTGFIWSPFVIAPCVFIGLLLVFINANRTIREELRRRVHF